MTKRVIFFITSLQSGGIENYLLRFIEEMGARFETITVFCKSGNGGQLEDEYLKFSNVRIVKHRIGYYSVSDYLFVDKLLRKNKFDTVCDFTGNFAGIILRCAKKNRIENRVVFYRNSSDRFESTWFKDIYNCFVKKLTLKFSTKILANSKAAMDYYFPGRWKYDNKFSVIYNGVNSARFLNKANNLRDQFEIPKGAFVIGHTGRYNPAKNHKTIVSVAIDLVRSTPNIYFILCGNGVRTNLGDEVNRMGLSDRIKLFENRSDIPTFLNTMDCYYFPSLTEGQPNSLIEAMVSGLPIVASDIRSIKETVPKCFHDHLIAPLDLNSAKKELLKVYNSQEQASTLKDWAIENFNSEKLFNKFYQQL